MSTFSSHPQRNVRSSFPRLWGPSRALNSGHPVYSNRVSGWHWVGEMSTSSLATLEAVKMSSLYPATQLKDHTNTVSKKSQPFSQPTTCLSKTTHANYVSGSNRIIRWYWKFLYLKKVTSFQRVMLPDILIWLNPKML